MAGNGTCRRVFLKRSAAVAVGLVYGLDTAHAQERGGFSHFPAAFDVSSRSALIWVRGKSDGQQAQMEWDQAGSFTSPASTPPVRLTSARDLTHVFELSDLEPEFFVHLGDTIYADHPRRGSFWGSLPLYRTKHAENRADAHMQKFMSVTPTFAMWDDHEVQDNFDRTHPSLAEGRQAFVEWWPRRGADPFKLHRHFSWGPLADFFLLDTRQYRSTVSAPEDTAKTMLGAEQKEWLKEGLRGSKAPLKIILSPSPFNSRTDRDSWGGYAGERRELDEFIATSNINRVIVISGDWHMAIDLSRVMTAIDEVVVGPIAAWPQFQMEPKNRRLVADSGRPHVGDEFNFGHGRVEAVPNGARLSLDVVDLSGNVRFTKVVES